jgi:hypothetical protein
LVKEFTETKSRKKQRFMRAALKGDRLMGNYAKEHSCPRRGLE